VNLPEKRHQPQKGNDVIQRNPSCKVISANAIDGSSELNPDSIHVVVMSFFLEHECRPLSLLKQLHPILKSKGNYPQGSKFRLLESNHPGKKMVWFSIS